MNIINQSQEKINSQYGTNFNIDIKNRNYDRTLSQNDDDPKIIYLGSTKMRSLTSLSLGHIRNQENDKTRALYARQVRNVIS